MPCSLILCPMVFFIIIKDDFFCLCCSYLSYLSSLLPFCVQLLIHRRLVVDDNRGVEEALNETTGGMSHYPDWQRSGDGITVTGKKIDHFLLLHGLNLTG